MSFVPLNPRPMLQGLVNKDVVVRLKWGQEYVGRLVSVDSYMNVQMSGAEEIDIKGENKGTLGQILIRCNNVLWIKSKDSRQENGDSDMAG